LQLVTSNVLNDSGTLNYIANSEHAFGNNGSTAEGGSIDSGSNTALNDIVGNGSLTPTDVYNAMNPTTGSDHLPVVSDYTIAVPEPSLAVGAILLCGLCLGRRRRAMAADPN
jgi:hypothetical protein